jgi:hypothetical protein
MEDLEDQAFQKSIKRASMLQSLMQKALGQKLKKSMMPLYQQNDEKILITTEEVGIQVELDPPNPSNDIAKVL